MASPFKRVCLGHSRRRISHRRQHPDFAQWHPLRSFSSTYITQQATPTSHNPYIQPFPDSETDRNVDPVYEDDELSSLAHAELAQHRELREMLRLAAWEMPRLSSLSQPFERPDPAHNPNHVLRWRYTSYMGEQHPALRKVVVEFKPAHLPNLDEKQRLKLLKLAGPRYDVGKQSIKMSCESFETQAQNKRYLGDTINKLIAEAKDPEADSFEDVPLDTRHRKPKRHFHFPPEWLLTEERKEELEAKRKAKLLEEGRKVEADRLVSGVAAIEAARKIHARKVEEPVMVEAQQSMPKGKMGRKQMGQR